jgi:flagellar biosynthesis/type III secretory pathway chaperone
MSVNIPAESEPRHRFHALLTQFDAVLATEYEALRHRDSEGLEQLIATKQRLADELDGYSEHLRHWQATTSADDEQWVAIRNLLARCALANRTNGAAIKASQNFVTSMLDLLTGRRVGERTYTARGRLGPGVTQSTYEQI